jgi:hypothetical protein
MKELSGVTATARINNDWIDEKVLSAFLKDLEENSGSDARFCLAE